jgi:alpha-aminoadipate carrier protein LysW
MESNDSCRLKKLESPKSGDFGLQTQRRKIMPTVTCPECEAQITLEAGTEVGEIIVCSDCGVDLEIITLEPATVQLAPMEQEDWGE